MVFVGEATRDGALNMKKGEFKIYVGEIARPVPMPGCGFAKPYPTCIENMSISAMLRQELEIRLAAAGLRLRRFPCCRYYDSWRMFGTEAV